MTEIPELKTCPFCGSKFKVSTDPQYNHPVGGMAYLYHDYGKMDSPARKCFLGVMNHFPSEEWAVEAWNNLSVHPDEIKLSVFLEALEKWGCNNDEKAKEILEFQSGGYDLNKYKDR